ncbi:titin homolog isoform X2 [Juglans microcarpa x Juglans regia]|uniref:titin homolog isoform X2 n=1 Tax=Juglans microcarpa x Juglans regia TaxID=2249226 RepID=UPI001B7DF303|nr:titin homolog isoform X2 [Juglans microcarpa x Juglans regia]
MASETAISDHTSTTDELQEVEKKVNEEEEKPKVGESPSPATASSKPEQAPEDKRIGPPLVEVEKSDDAPAYSTEEKDFISRSHSPAVPEPVADTIETQSEKQTAMETVIKEAPKQVALALLEKGPEEKPKIVDVPEPIAEAPQKLLETLDVLPAKDSESVAIGEIKNLGVSIKVERPEVAALEQSEHYEQVEKAYEEVEIKESVETDADKDPRTSVEKVENTQLLKEVQTDEEEEAGVLRNSEQAPTNQEAQSDLKEDGMDFSLPVTVTEKVDAEDKKKFSGADVVGEAVVEIGNLSEENVARTGDQITEVVNEKKNEVLEESTLPVEVEEVDSFPSTTEVNEKSMEGDNISRDVEVAIKGNKGEQNVKDEILAFPETSKDEPVEEKQAEVTRVVSKPLKEAQEPELQLRSEETVETSENKLEKGKVDEIAKCDVQNLKPSVQESKLQVRTGETVETSDDNLEKGKADEIAKPDFQNLEPSVQELELHVRSEEESVETGEDKLEKGKVVEIAKPDVQNLEPSLQESELLVGSEESVEIGEDKLVKGKVDEIAKADVQNLEPTVQEPVLRSEEESVETGEDKLEKGKVVEIAKPDVQNLEPSVQEVPELLVRSEESVGTGEDKLEKGKVVEIAKADVQNLEPSVQEPKLLVRSEKESVETGEDKLEKGKVDEIANASVQNLEPSTLESELQVRSEGTLETGEEKREKGEVGEIAKANVQNLEPSTPESKLQVRSEETVETSEEKREKGNAGEIAKSHVQNLEPTINDVGDETKISQDPTKEHPTKSTPKQSNNIMSKVKQSLAKAKKAIIGKSPNSKTLSSETKGDINVK